MRVLPLPSDASGGCLRVGAYLGGLWAVPRYIGNPVSSIQRCCNCHRVTAGIVVSFLSLPVVYCMVQGRRETSIKVLSGLSPLTLPSAPH